MNRDYQENQNGVANLTGDRRAAEGLSVKMPQGILMDGIDQVATVQPLL